MQAKLSSAKQGHTRPHGLKRGSGWSSCKLLGCFCMWRACYRRTGKRLVQNHARVCGSPQGRKFFVVLKLERFFFCSTELTCCSVFREGPFRNRKPQRARGSTSPDFLTILTASVPAGLLASHASFLSILLGILHEMKAGMLGDYDAAVKTIRRCFCFRFHVLPPKRRRRPALCDG